MNDRRPETIVIAASAGEAMDRLRRPLERHHVSIVQVEDGREAVAVIRREQPALVLIDQGLPPVDGCRLCLQLKVDPELAAIPVILAMPLDDPDGLLRGLDSGADTLLFTPSNDGELLARIEAAQAAAHRSASRPGLLPREPLVGDHPVRPGASRAQLIELAASLQRSAIATAGELRQTQARLRASHEAQERWVAERTAEQQRAIEQLRKDNETLTRAVAERTGELAAVRTELCQARTASEQASRTKSAFLATMSHEIRTPMNGVLGMIDVLAHGQLSEHQADLVGTIRESAATLLALIDDILDFSKIEAGRLEIERAPLSVADLVECVCNSLLPVAQRAGAEFSLFVDPEIPERVMGDDVRLRQTLYNLIGNAIKFSSGQPHRAGRISVRVERSGGDVETLWFLVSDNGIGMKPATLERLFLPFNQGEVSTTRRFGGTGLGLSICKRLVELMRGSIQVKSREGIGSTFMFGLPLELAPSQPAAGLPTLDGLDIVVVRAPGFAADDIAVLLRHARAQVRLVADLAEAVAAVAAGASMTTLIVVSQVGQTERASLERLRSLFADQPEVHHLLITRGRRRSARLAEPNVVTLDGNAMRRRALLNAVAVAAGRAVVETSHEPTDLDGDPARPPPSIAEARARGELLLVAEDDAINRKVVLQQLALLGYAAEVAVNGAEALTMWRNGRYALLLTDLHMPEMDGYALARAIRSSEGEQPRLPILALTANAVRGEAVRAEQAGMDEYLTKPVPLPRLRDALRRWLQHAVVETADTASAEPETTAEPSMPAAGRAEPPVFDLSILSALVGDEPAVLREFITDYRRSAGHLMEELRCAYAAGLGRQIGAVAHKLKSGSRAVGALVLGDRCAELENACTACKREAVIAAVEALEAAWTAVDAITLEWLNDPQEPAPLLADPLLQERP